MLEQSIADPHSWKANIFDAALKFSTDFKYDVRAVLEHSYQCPKSWKGSIQFDFRSVIEILSDKTKIDFDVRAVLEQSTDDPHSWKDNIFEAALEISTVI